MATICTRTPRGRIGRAKKVYFHILSHGVDSKDGQIKDVTFELDNKIVTLSRAEIDDMAIMSVGGFVDSTR